MSTSAKATKRELTGRVVSKSGDKTIRVLVETLKRHKVYKKVFKSSKKYLAHDEKNQAGEGDRVQIIECRPYSKNKTWRLNTILEKKEG